MAVGDVVGARVPRAAPHPAIPSNELIQRVETAIRAEKFSPAGILKALRARDVSPWHPDDVERLCNALAAIDPIWSLRLQVVLRVLPARRGEFTARVHKALVDLAQRETDYPAVRGEDAETGAAMTDWARTALSGDPPKATATLMTAMWLDRRARWSTDLVTGIMRKVAGDVRGGPTTIEIAARMIVGPAALSRIRETVRLLASVLAERDDAIADRTAATEAADRARSARLKAEGELRETNEKLDRSRRALEEATRQIAAIRDELDLSRTDSQHALLGERTVAANEIGQLRARVLRVLRHELDQIRLYLDRPAPNVADALARLGHIDALRSELEERGGNG